MPISEYIRAIRAKIGTDMLFMPGVAGVVINEAGEILLQRRSDNGQWGLPGGAIDPGEEPADAVVREVFEETGVQVIPERLVGIYSGPDFYMRYPNGDEAMILSVAFACRPIAGEPRVNDDESLEVRYFPPDALPPLIDRNVLRIRQALAGDIRTDFRFQGKSQLDLRQSQGVTDMTRRVIHSDNAPKAQGPYSHAIVANGFVFCSGQVGIDPTTGKLVEGGVGAQTTQTLKNLEAVLISAGTSLTNVVKVNVFLKHISDFQAMNAAYAAIFTAGQPARSTVGDLVLPLNEALVEIEVVAVLP